MQIQTELTEYIQDALFYHNSYLPKKPDDWRIYNFILIDSIIEFLDPPKHRKKQRQEMKTEMERFRKEGESLAMIGRRFGTSRQYIHQILNDYDRGRNPKKNQ